MLPRVFSSKRRKALGGGAAALVVGLVTVGAALAFYGGSGSGSASASAGHAPRAVTVSGALAAADSPLYPGQTGTVNIAVALTGPGNAHVGSVSASSITTSDVGCLPSWFSFNPPAPAQFPNGANVSSGSPLNVTGSLTFTESGTLQDACSDATLQINLQASPS